MKGKSTVQIMQSLSGGEYSDPFQVRAIISRDGIRPDSFALRFWRMLHMASECPFIERWISEGAQSAAAMLPADRRQEWLDLTAERPDDRLAAVDFLHGICVNKPLCRPCRCKDRVISFLSAVMGGDDKARNAAKRNVSNWLTDRQPVDRAAYIRLCYALGLRTLGENTTAEKAKSADRFLALHCTQNPLHLSDAEEAVHYYCLRYPMGRELSAEEDYSSIDNYNYALSLIDRIGTVSMRVDDSWMFTAEAGRDIDTMRTEEDILAYAQSCRSHQSDDYYTARCVLRDFVAAYDEELTLAGQTGARMRTGITKDDARRAVAAFERLDCDITALEEIAPHAGRPGDLLYASDIARETADGERPVSRTVLLLCLLAQNCGAVFSPEEMDMVQTEEFTDVRSFNEFFRLLNVTLADCSMAPMNPHRRLDFLILYSYFLFSRDALMGELTDTFPVYMARAMERFELS